MNVPTTLDDPIPYALIGRIVKVMAQERRKPAKKAPGSRRSREDCAIASATLSLRPRASCRLATCD